MKKLSRLKLHNVAILNDDEMKCITGGYVNSSYASDSSLCAPGERLYQCYINLDGVCDLSTSYSLGAVCAKSSTLAMKKSRKQLNSVGVTGYAQTCI